MVRWRLLVLSFVPLWHIGFCQEAFMQNETELIDSIVKDWMKCRNIPGLGISLIRDRKFFAKGYGLARLDQPVNFTETTPIYVASLGKAFTAALLGVMMTEARSQSVSRDWDTKLSSVFKENFKLPDKFLESELTIKDLLSQRTGFSPADVYTGLPKIGRKEFVKRLKYLPKSAAFRDQWIYNDLLYSIAGHVAEEWMDTEYESLIESKLLRPIGMFQAVCGTDIYPNSSKTEYALPYHYAGEGLRVGNKLIYQIGDVGPAGCISASPQDLAKWIRFMSSGGKTVDGYQLIHPDVFKEIIKPQMILDDWSINRFLLDNDYPVQASGTWYGFGWYGGSYRGYKKLLHPGNWYGYSAVAGFFPDQKAGFVISINGPWYNNYKVTLAPLTYVLSDILLGEKQWIDNNTICSFPFPWKSTGTSTTNNHTMSTQSNQMDMNQFTGDYGHRIFGTLKIREIESQKLSFQMNSAGIGNLTLVSDGVGKFRMTFNELLSDVAESTCSLQFFTKSEGKYQKVTISCLYSTFEYQRGVNFLSPEPETGTAAVIILSWIPLLFCFLNVLL
ncbi:uncharacterized protein LOC133193512 [Saccostrea echinata]|uniref:uncharacterized protein LOC133193512 n=1 Tax=Saccostrea echinata TaxID=191078 RepID=UPI002A80CA5F|nr:uncharacterized protein LOC133193512 [Saccostrea echinata]